MAWNSFWDTVSSKIIPGHRHPHARGHLPAGTAWIPERPGRSLHHGWWESGLEAHSAPWEPTLHRGWTEGNLAVKREIWKVFGPAFRWHVYPGEISKLEVLPTLYAQSWYRDNTLLLTRWISEDLHLLSYNFPGQDMGMVVL